MEAALKRKRPASLMSEEEPKRARVQEDITEQQPSKSPLQLEKSPVQPLEALVPVPVPIPVPVLIQPADPLRAYLEQVMSPSGSQYMLQGVIGAGGFGQVFLGTTTATPTRKLALKKQPLRKLNLQLVTEIVHLKNLAHENLIQYVDSYISEEDIWIVTEYVDGITLTQLMRHNKEHNTAISLNLLAGIATQLLVGVVFLHERVIIHRDIKPDNIMVDNSGCVKILDLGLSIREGFNYNIAGTYSYMAPEVHNGLHYGRSVDVWSVGMTLIALWNCSTPFRGLSKKEIKEQVSQGKLPLLHNAPWLPFSFFNFIFSCVDVLPVRRLPATTLIWHEFLTAYHMSRADLAQVVIGIQGPRERESSSDEEIRVTDSRSPGNH
jgi:serine/threonine protein kinase